MIHTKSDLLNKTIDIREMFSGDNDLIFNAVQVSDFDKNSQTGKIRWDRYSNKPRMAFNNIALSYEKTPIWEFPPEYEENPCYPFSISFVSDRTIRLKFNLGNRIVKEEQSMMLLKEPAKYNWDVEEGNDKITYSSKYGKVVLEYNPFRIFIYDDKDNIITQTRTFGDSYCLKNNEPIPFSIVRRSSDFKKMMAASFGLAHDEKIYGCGESFTRLNKRGQYIPLCTIDANGAQTKDMYKPIPFYISSRGYGMFVNTSTPMSFDFGSLYDDTLTTYVSDNTVDMFIFIGNPKEVVSEYTALTGRSEVPPLWSFGLWMSRITYKAEDEVRQVADRLRENKIPCDVIHIDTGWFEKDWRCDYEFSKSRFDDPEKMIGDLKESGFHISLWQLPYFTPYNKLYAEAIEKGYVVLSEDNELPTEDAIIDFSNEDAVKWYQNLLRKLLEMGVGAIKADFGEAAPIFGRYASGKSGHYEHNLYPLRYNKAVSEVTKEVNNESIIWARSAWSGSQRYPLHWGGDAENTDSAMAASLRAGLSLGLCGFTFWSHDIGGFVRKSPEELYTRWMPFGMLTSHSRCHGEPPKEPWEYSNEFVEVFRESVELKYQLMPYIYTEAVKSAMNGYPMMRTLFFEFPEDKTAWLIEDEYFFGENLLVAPIFEPDCDNREVYLPVGDWVQYGTNNRFKGGRWINAKKDSLPILIFIKDGSIIPRVAVSQCTKDIDWANIQLDMYTTVDAEDNQKQELNIYSDKDCVKVNVEGDTVDYVSDNNKEYNFNIIKY